MSPKATTTQWKTKQIKVLLLQTWYYHSFDSVVDTWFPQKIFPNKFPQSEHIGVDTIMSECHEYIHIFIENIPRVCSSGCVPKISWHQNGNTICYSFEWTYFLLIRVEKSHRKKRTHFFPRLSLVFSFTCWQCFVASHEFDWQNQSKYFAYWAGNIKAFLFENWKKMREKQLAYNSSN